MMALRYTLFAVAALAGPAIAQTSDPPQSASETFTVSFPSSLPSENAINDQIWLTVYRARTNSPAPTPMVVLIHPLGERGKSQLNHFGRYLAARGIGAAA